jgi:hypothetical protein
MNRPQMAGQSLGLLGYIADILDRRSIPNLTIGAVAVAFHGVVRASLDALISIKEDAPQGTNSVRSQLIDDLRREGFAVEFREPDLFDPVWGLIEVQDSFGNRVDLLLGLRGVDTQVFSRGKRVALGDIHLNLVSAEDLIVMKVLAGSSRDLTDAEGILRIQEGKLDLEHIRTALLNVGEEELTRFEALLNAVSSLA